MPTESQETYAQLAVHDKQIKALEKRMEIQESNMREFTSLTISVNKLATNMETMIEVQKKQGAAIETLQNEPAERWNGTKKTFFTAITSSIGTAITGGIIWLFLFAANNMK